MEKKKILSETFLSTSDAGEILNIQKHLKLETSLMDNIFIFEYRVFNLGWRRDRSFYTKSIPEIP